MNPSENRRSRLGEIRGGLIALRDDLRSRNPATWENDLDLLADAVNSLQSLEERAKEAEARAERAEKRRAEAVKLGERGLMSGWKGRAETAEARAEALEERVEKAEARAVELATAHGRVSGKLLHARERCEELARALEELVAASSDMRAEVPPKTLSRFFAAIRLAREALDRYQGEG